MKSASSDRQLKEAQFEIMVLRGDLARSQEQRRRLAAEWAEIRQSRGFQFLLSLYALRRRLMPPASRRERLGLTLVEAIARCAGPIVRLGRGSVEQPARDGAVDAAALHTSVVQTDASAHRDLHNRRADLAADLSFVHPAWNGDKRLDLEAIPFSPSDWRSFEPAHSDSRGVNLAIFSLLHRSGSTLLQRICNARRGTLIWGEHNAALKHFADVYRSVAGFSARSRAERDAYFEQGENPNLWIANMCPDMEYVERSVVRSATALLETLYGQYRESHDIVGFKEVRYGQAEAHLLQRCFPQARLLLLVRHPFHTWSSTPHGWYPSFDVWASMWRTGAIEFLSLATSNPNCYLIRYEDLVRRQPGTLETLAEVAKVSDEEIAGVLAKKIGSSRHGRLGEPERRAIQDRCGDAMALLGYEADE